MGRILAVDPGTKRVGLALTDPGKKIASPLETIPFVSVAKLAERLAALCREKDVELVLMGLPVREDGYEGAGCRRSRIIAERLVSAGIPCRLWDESWSSREAEEILASEGMNRRNAKGRVDAVAASLFLREYLDSGPSAAIPRAASLPESP